MLDKLVNIFDDLAYGGRIEDLHQIAQEYQLPFQKRASFGAQATEIKGFKAFAGKGSKRLLGIITQSLAAVKGTVRFYDFLRTKDLETKTTSVVELYCEDIFTEYILIQPKGAFSKMKGFFMSEEKAFPNLETFHQNFQISTKSAEAFFTLQEAALDLMNNHPGLTIEMDGNCFLFYIPKKKMEVQNIIPIIDFAEEFVRLLCFDRPGDFV